MSDEHDEHAEALAKLRADVDQALESVKAMAQATHAFYATSREEGFSHEDALMLTGVWLTSMAPR